MTQNCPFFKMRLPTSLCLESGHTDALFNPSEIETAMKEISISILFFLTFLEAKAQFSLGGDLIGMGLSRSPQSKDVLRLDSSLASSRFIFSLNTNLVGAYTTKDWEFSLGFGYGNYIWKQKFDASTDDLKALVGLKELPDTSDILRRVSYSSKLTTLPVGVKYLF